MITREVIPYLSNYHDPFSTAEIIPIHCPLVVYKFFGYVNEVSSHKKSRQSYLEPEKFWVTPCDCLWLCTEFSTGITITNFWKKNCGVKRYKYENFIVIIELLERLILDLCKNPFSTDTGNPENKIPLLDDFNGG